MTKPSARAGSTADVGAHAASQGDPADRPRRYELAIVLILCLAYGMASFEMFSINSLIPFIQPDLRLTNTQIGMIVSIYWVFFAVSGAGAGQIADRTGRRKLPLVIILLLFSIFSCLSGFATSFTTLLGARALMGLLEGPVLPLAQSLVALESSPERRGANMGIVQIGGASLLSVIAPLLLVHIASVSSWRYGFYIVALPALTCAVLVALFIRESAVVAPGTHESGVAAPARSVTHDVFGSLNVWLCAGISTFMVAYLTIAASFFPSYLVQHRGLSAQAMSVVLSILGMAGLTFGIVLPAISDRIGRKPVAIAAAFAGVLCPLAVAYYHGPIWAMTATMFVGWAFTGGATLYFALIPSESVSPPALSSAIGFVIGISTIAGGVGGPLGAGWSADHFGPNSPMVLATVCAFAAGILAFFLRETACARIATGAALA